MIITRISLTNWKNFQSVDARLGNRVFLVGPNAAGKSNLLDVFRFLRDIVKPGGGLAKAISDRGGLTKIRCLAARKDPAVSVEVELKTPGTTEPTWLYSISIKQQPRGDRLTVLAKERVLRDGKALLERPVQEDLDDPLRTTQTHLEQLNANREFRQIYDFFGAISYLHLIPQLLRFPEAFTGSDISEDPFGKSFLTRVANTSSKSRQSRLRKIEEALKSAVPHLKNLTQMTDDKGMPHLEATYDHWRSLGAKQTEEQFSDGTLRLIGLLWSLLDSNSLLLLEEPELSLNSEIIKRIPALMQRLQRKRGRQVIVSTHSYDLLSDASIGGEEVLLLKPEKEGTSAELASDKDEVRVLLDSGLSVAEAALPYIAPTNAFQLDMFDE